MSNIFDELFIFNKSYKKMEEKLHSQSSDFFAEEKKYKRFEEYLHHNGMDPRRVPFS